MMTRKKSKRVDRKKKKIIRAGSWTKHKRNLQFQDFIQACPIKGKAIPVQAWTGPEGSRRLGLPDFKTNDTLRW